jgi:hypothetical protein
MIPKYTVEYRIKFSKHIQSLHYGTDDPVACEEFVLDLLERGFRIDAINHEGVPLSKHDFDRMLKTAAGMLAARHLCLSLGIDADEEKYRFGIAL